jgi:hypothetical protein
LTARQLAPDEDVVILQEIAPGSVAERRRPLRRANDVGEHDRCQDGVRDGLGLEA